MRYIVYGGNLLKGEIVLQGSKNGSLPLLAAAVLTRSKIAFKRIPKISDVDDFLYLCLKLGVKYSWNDSVLNIDASDITYNELDSKDIKKIRASIYLLPILSTLTNTFTFFTPGGCNFSKRPIDFHLQVFNDLGIASTCNNDAINFEVLDKKSNTIDLKYPSFGTTINAILLASTIDDVTTITNTACEPEIINLINFLKLKGIDITYLNGTIIIKGTNIYNQIDSYENIGDRIACATYLSLGILCSEKLTIKNIPTNDLDDFFLLLAKANIPYDLSKEKISVYQHNVENSLTISAEPYPGFSTDILPIIVPLLAKGDGISIIKDTVYPSRKSYLSELEKFNCNISSLNQGNLIIGTEKLNPAIVSATDLRGGMAELLLALSIKGKSIINNAQYIERGYENLIPTLTTLGAKIEVQDE